MQGSEGVRDLIHRLLRPNVAERMTMQQIFTHPWFQENLADGALELNDALLHAVGAEYAAAGDLQVILLPIHPSNTQLHIYGLIYSVNDTGSMMQNVESGIQYIRTHLQALAQARDCAQV